MLGDSIDETGFRGNEDSIVKKLPLWIKNPFEDKFHVALVVMLIT